MTKHPRRSRSTFALGALAVLSATLSGIVGIPSASASAAQPEAPRDGLLAEYLFDQAGGTTVADTSGGSAGPATVVNGRDALWTGDSLTLTGGAKSSTTANWVRLPDGLLAGKTSATITTETKFDDSMASAFHFLWNIGSDSTASYWFATLKDKARTAITTAGNNGEANARTTTSLASDRWYSITSVIDGEAGAISFYIDGQRVGRTPTTLKPASVAAQTLNAIGRSPYPDPFYKGEVSAFRVYDRVLSASEVAQVSDADAAAHAATFSSSAQAALDAIGTIAITDSAITLPVSTAASVTWSEPSAGLALGASGTTLHAVQPAPGEPALTGSVTATATVRGVSVSKEVPVTVAPAAAASDPYGYLMVHFIEDSAGYAEKIYLDISRGDDPEQWDPLNSGRPILASQLGTTGIRDPYLTYNPETKTYYIIATDLRVFGGDGGSGSCTSWCHWTHDGSTKLVVWESEDLVGWGEPRSFDVALDAQGQKAIELGMAWAPEATWVDGYNADGSGAFVLYWSSNVYRTTDHSDASYNQVLWGATTDFTQNTYAYGGSFVDSGSNSIDTTMIQNDGTTYRITKDNGLGKGIYMESTTAERWWEPGTSWTTLQTRIGASWAGGNAGGVEGPAVFKSHSDEKWYLYVDVIPTTGYRPLVTTDLDAGWTVLNDPSFHMAPSTKHGGVISLIKGQYDTIRASDAVAAVSAELGTVGLPVGSSADDLAAALPATAAVTLAYGRGTAELPVAWDTASVDLTQPGSYSATGTVHTIGGNLNTWTGAGGSTAWNAPDRTLARSTALTVTAQVVVSDAAPVLEVTAVTRCVAGKAVLVTTVSNASDEKTGVAIDTAYGTKTVELAAGKGLSQTFSTRTASIPAGTVTAESDAGTQSAAYTARSCG